MELLKQVRGFEPLTGKGFNIERAGKVKVYKDGKLIRIEHANGKTSKVFSPALPSHQVLPKTTKRRTK